MDTGIGMKATRFRMAELGQIIQHHFASRGAERQLERTLALL